MKLQKSILPDCSSKMWRLNSRSQFNPLP